jgi:hypothetical protein
MESRAEPSLEALPTHSSGIKCREVAVGTKRLYPFDMNAAEVDVGTYSAECRRLGRFLL